MKQSEETLRAAIESIPDGFALFDSDDRLVLVNETFFKNREDLKESFHLGMTFEEMSFLREDFRTRELEEGNDTVTLEERVRLHKDPTGPFQISLSDGRTLQINEVKTPNGGIAIIRTDVTALKQAEASLVQSEGVYQTLVDGSPNAIYFHKDEKIVYANPAMAELLGVSSGDELIGRPAFGHITEPFKRIIKQRWKSLHDTGETEMPLRQSFCRIDGTLVDVETQGTRIVYQSEFAVLVVAQDMTERRKIEEARDRLLQAVEALPIGVVLFDHEDKLFFFNASYAKQMNDIADILEPGRSFEELLRAIVARNPNKDAKGREEEFIQERLERHRNPSDPISIRRANGAWLQAEETRLGDGSTFTTISDITELQEAQSALQKANDDLELRIDIRTAHLESEIVERKRTEQELSKSEERFRTLINSANYGILVHRNHLPIYANKALAILYGYRSPDDILALKSTSVLTHPDFEKGTHEVRLSEDNISADKETMGVRTNGKAFWEERRSFIINWGDEKAV